MVELVSQPNRICGSLDMRLKFRQNYAECEILDTFLLYSSTCSHSIKFSYKYASTNFSLLPIVSCTIFCIETRVNNAKMNMNVRAANRFFISRRICILHARSMRRDLNRYTENLRIVMQTTYLGSLSKLARKKSLSVKGTTIFCSSFQGFHFPLIEVIEFISIRTYRQRELQNCILYLLHLLLFVSRSS